MKTLVLFFLAVCGTVRVSGQATEQHKDEKTRITSSLPPSIDYPGIGGVAGLVNGEKAEDLNSREWVGWQGDTVELTVTPARPRLVYEVVLHTMEKKDEMIWLPGMVEIGFHYTDAHGIPQFTSIEIEQPEEGWGETRELRFTFEPKMVSTITIRLAPLMKIPEGYPGVGGPAWMLLDEIEFN